MPTATMLESRLRLKPRSWAIGRKKGPKLRRMPEDRSVRNAAAATMFQPKYHRAAMRASYAKTPCGLPLGTCVVHGARPSDQASSMKTQIPAPDQYQEMREALRDLCGRF